MGTGDTTSTGHRHSARHAVLGALALVAAVLLVGVVTDAAQASQASIPIATRVVADPVSEAATPTASVHPKAAVQRTLITANSAVDIGEQTLAETDGRTLDESARDDLRAGIAEARSLITSALITASGREADGANDFAWQPHTATSLAIEAVEIAALLDDSVSTIERSIDEVSEAVEAWEDEQARIAAAEAERKRVAAEAAAAAAAARAAAESATSGGAVYDDDASSSWESSDDDWHAAGDVGSAPTPAPAPTGPPPADWSEYVWTSGFQGELDACAGSVDLSPTYGVRVIGEHWYCGGAGFPTWSGAIVEMSGVVGGRYRVEGIAAVLDGASANSNDIPGGYDLLYQTCLDNDTSRMAFIGLTWVG